MAIDPNSKKQQQTIGRLVSGFIALFFVLPMVMGGLESLGDGARFEAIGQLIFVGIVVIFLLGAARKLKNYQGFEKLIRDQLNRHDDHAGDPKTPADFPEARPSPPSNLAGKFTPPPPTGPVYKNQPTKPGDTI